MREQAEHPEHVPDAKLKGRFTFIDALRGIAALSVVVFHFYSQLWTEGQPRLLPNGLHEIVLHGFLGVEIFFVLSGFVIAHSVHRAWVTPGFVGNFAFRRSLRLDPPYWIVIALSYVALRVSNAALTERTLEIPGPVDVVANLFYLDNLLGLRSVVKVGWTLCLEVQFYLVFVLLVGVTQRLAKRGLGPYARVLIFAPLAVYALAVQGGALPLPLHGLFVEYWFLFFTGAMTWWCLAGEAPWFGFFAVIALGVVELIARLDIRTVVACSVATGIFVVGRKGLLTTLLRGRVLQYFGRISYSLYLVHPLIGHRILRISVRKLHGVTPVTATISFCVALLVSVVAAEMLYRAVEKPAVRWSKRFRRVQPVSGSAVVESPSPVLSSGQIVEG